MRENGITKQLPKSKKAKLKVFDLTDLQQLMNWCEITPPEYILLSERSLKELKTTGVCKPFEKEYIRKNLG